MGHDVVVIGSSTGGLAPLRDIVAGLPAVLDVANSIVQHVGDLPTQLPTILNAESPLPVSFASDGERFFKGPSLCRASGPTHAAPQRPRSAAPQSAGEHESSRDRPAVPQRRLLFRSTRNWHRPFGITQRRQRRPSRGKAGWRHCRGSKSRRGHRLCDARKRLERGAGLTLRRTSVSKPRSRHRRWSEWLSKTSWASARCSPVPNALAYSGTWRTGLWTGIPRPRPSLASTIIRSGVSRKAAATASVKAIAQTL